MPHEERQQLVIVKCGRLQRIDIADDDVSAQLNDAATERHPPIQGRGCTNDAIDTDHRSFDHLAGRKRHDERDHCAGGKVDGANFLVGFEQQGVLLEGDGLQMWLEDFEIGFGKLPQQEVLHSSLLGTGGSAKNCQLSVPHADIR
ncbi:hypothetical protein [Bradyrhizobium sp. cf659]|uniref:hypothetical protein n=1 Tax=Bradyrhizobium sp. cf659 TaxID=1761771 RepID=UPI0008E7B772|nr:hypothetical protein [Bradyrhizobium sp. cf659]SFI29920.1 hypothetical protein SAMN04487925_102614 [Bradyrhizobium sp. cf659]